MVERRASKFTEVLSIRLVWIAALGAFFVLLDPRFTLTVAGQAFSLGTQDGFSADLKGAVIASILISGYTAVKEFWLGSSASGQTQAESISRIAEASGPTTAAAVAAVAATQNGHSAKEGSDDKSVTITGKGEIT